MNFEIKSLDAVRAAQIKCDALLVLVSEPAGLPPGPIADLLQWALKQGDFEAQAGRLLQHYRPSDVRAPRLWLLGAGSASAGQLRNAMAAAMTSLKKAPVRHLVVLLPRALSGQALIAAMQAVADGAYVYRTTRSKTEQPALSRVTLAVDDAPRLKADFEWACALLEGQAVTREWANRPPNHATPSHLAKAAQSLAKAHKLGCEVLGPQEVKALGMGAFSAVSAGSREPLRFIVLRYQGAAPSQAPTVLVGKGVTFDAGGISLKPAPEMDEMKFDMCGAASVLGVFRALAALRPALNVVGLIPACENLPDGAAVKPGDVVTSMSGQTIEILNTDAEGRLILCDALCYAERFKPRAVIDIATLTGACVIALGAVRHGLFSSHDELAAALQGAGETALDPCWRMPLDEDYAEGLKSHFADVANVAGRAAGSVTAAKFLQRFTQAYPWAHLDIAGTAWKSGANKGATGRPVALLLRYLTQAASQATSQVSTGRRGRRTPARKPA